MTLFCAQADRAAWEKMAKRGQSLVKRVAVEKRKVVVCHKYLGKRLF